MDKSNSSRNSADDTQGIYVEDLCIKTHTMNQECYACNCFLNLDDMVQCCFPCKQMFCVPCIEKDVHAFLSDISYPAMNLTKLKNKIRPSSLDNPEKITFS